MKKQELFRLKCGGAAEPQVELVSGFHKMRPWQEEAFILLKDAPHIILNAPMGSGKSWMMCLLSTVKMKQDTNLRCIIAVPQEIIAPGFAEAKLTLPDGEKIHWTPKHYLCNRSAGKSTTEHIINWLQSSYVTLSEQTLICTHRALVIAYKKLKQDGRLHLVKDLLLWVDEAHHIKNAEIEGIEGPPISNEIGEMVASLLHRASDNIQIGLTTASFFRGDRYSLLTEKMESQFSRYNLPYDIYLKSMHYLESFTFDFLLCGYDYTKAIGMLAREQQGKDIVYIPHPRSRVSLGNKSREVETIVSEYEKVHGNRIADSQSVFIRLENPSQEFKILDLVDINRRNEKKALFRGNILRDNPEALDAIIALGMFKEGADWIWADRSIIVGPRASFVDVIQMIGRLFRDAKGKKHVKVIQLLPFIIDQHNCEFQDQLNNYFKAICATLLLEDILEPVKILVPSSQTKNENGKKEEASSSRLNDLVPDESTAQSLIEEGYRVATKISAEAKKENRDFASVYEDFQKEFIPIIESLTGSDRAQEIADKIYGMMVRQTLHMQGIKVECIDISIIRSTHPLDGFLRYTSDACGIDTLQQLRDAIRSHGEELSVRWNFHYGLAVEYAKLHGNGRIHKNYQQTVEGKTVKLGSWLNDQKKNYSSLSAEKKELLHKLPGFNPKKFVRNKSLSIDEWIAMFARESKKLGTKLIPNTYVTEDGYNLGSWIQHIRKKNEWERLTEEQKTSLLGHGFILSAEKEWDTAALKAMTQFVEREKTTVPKSEHKETVFHLGEKYVIRLDNLRNKIKNHPESVDEEFLAQIMSIPNFQEELRDLNVENAKYLQNGLDSYIRFVERNGVRLIPETCRIGDFDLAEWYKKLKGGKKINDAYKARLIAIDPLFFAPQQVRVFFLEIRPQIESYIEKNGDALIPQDYVTPDGCLLGQKVSDLRESRERLERPVFEYLIGLNDKWAWHAFEAAHIQKVKELISYFEKNGSSIHDLPKNIRDLRKKVLQGFEKYPSSADTKIVIENLAPGFFKDPEDPYYPALLKYVARTKQACPPIKHLEDGVSIGLHISRIRQKKKAGTLSADEQEKYASLPGWKWDALGRNRVED